PLRIMWWGSQTRHERTLAVLNMFTKKTGVRFEPEFYGFDEYFSKLNILIAANDPPDLMQMGGNFPTYMEHIEPLKKYIQDGTIDVSNTDKSFISITTLEGNTVGLSSGTNAPAIAYDPAIFKKAGVPLPNFKWTWSDFEKAALTIHKKLGILGCGLTRNDEFWSLTTYVSQYDTGESLFLEPYRLKLNYKNDKYIVDYLKRVQRLTKAGAYPNPAQMAEIKDIEGNPLVRGEAAMAWLYSNQFVALSKAAGLPLALVCLPRVKRNGPLAQTIMSSQMFCIAKNSKHKKAAAEFINFFINDVEANLVLKGERGVPIMRHIREALAPQLSEAEKEIYNYLNQLGKEAATGIVLDSPVQTQIRDIYIRLAEEVVFNKITPAEAAKRVRAEAEDALKRYAQQQ
ncbi:MAG: carbohydrate ABC transporter substrate-binding protein, partial [Firmicutes bacterium]|nr:carbohydrate ABC transporter substrate-binding protein [Bacillota bacterium]